MKHILILLSIFLLISCNTKYETIEEQNILFESKDSITIETKYGTHTYAKDWYNAIAKKYHTKEDSVAIKIYKGYVYLSKEEYSEVVAGHPEFFQNEISGPFDTYLKASYTLPMSEKPWYKVLYGHFLKQRFDYENYIEEIEHVKEIEETKVELHGSLYGRGTWHGSASVTAEIEALYKVYEFSIFGIELQPEEEFQNNKKIFMDAKWKELEEANIEGFGLEDLIEAGVYKRETLYGYAKSNLLRLEELLTNSFYLSIVHEK